MRIPLAAEIKHNDTVLFKQLLAPNSQEFRHLIEKIKKDESYKNYLFKLIDLSKSSKIKRDAIAAANAITLLNAAGVTFIRQDWKGIKIPGADLSGAILHHINLEGADLNDVKLYKAWLSQVNLSGTHLYNIKYGQRERFNFNSFSIFNPAVVSRDGLWLATAEVDIKKNRSELVLYSLTLRKEVQRQKLPGVCYIHDFNSTGNQLIIESSMQRWTTRPEFDDAELLLWDINLKKVSSIPIPITEVRSFTYMGPHETVFRAELKPTNTDKSYRLVLDKTNKNILAVSQDQQSVSLWNIESGEKKTLGTSPRILYMAYNPEKNCLAVATSYNAIEFWDIEKNERMALPKKISVETLLDHPPLKFNTQGTILASYHQQGILLWDMKTGELHKKIFGLTDVDIEAIDHKGLISAMAFNPNGNSLAISYYCGIIRIIEIISGKEIQRFSGFAQNLYFNATGTSIIAVVNGESNFWDLHEKEQRPYHKGPTNTIMDATILAKENIIITLAKSDADFCSRSNPIPYSLQYWDLKTAQHSLTLPIKRGYGEVTIQKNKVISLYPNPCEATLFSLYSLDFNTKEQTNVVTKFRDASGVFSPDENLLILTNNKLVWLNPETDDIIKENHLSSNIHIDHFQSLVIDPSGKYIAVYSYLGYLYLIAIPTQPALVLEPTQPPLYKQAQVFQLSKVVSAKGFAFNCDGSLLACGRENGLINIYDVTTLEDAFKPIWPHIDGEPFTAIDLIAFDPVNKNRLISKCKSKNAIRLWDVATNTCLYTFELPTQPHKIKWVTNTEDNSYLVLTSEDTIYIYDVVELQKKIPRFNIRWILTECPTLCLSGINITNAKGLSVEDKRLFQQWKEVPWQQEAMPEEKQRVEQIAAVPKYLPIRPKPPTKDELNDPDEKGERPLHRALHSLAAVKRLLDQKANTNLANAQYEPPFEALGSPLWANKAIFMLLLERCTRTTAEEIEKSLEHGRYHYRDAFEARDANQEHLHRIVSDLLGTDIKKLITTHLWKYLGQLHSLQGEYQAREQKEAQSFESFYPIDFLPIRIRILFELIIEIENGAIPAAKLPQPFDTSLVVERETILSKLKHVLTNQVESFRVRRHLEYLRTMQAKESAVQTALANNIVDYIFATTNAKDIYRVYTIPFSYRYKKKADDKDDVGHCIYINFRYLGDKIEVRIDNVGAGSHLHIDSIDGEKQYPFVFSFTGDDGSAPRVNPEKALKLELRRYLIRLFQILINLNYPVGDKGLVECIYGQSPMPNGYKQLGIDLLLERYNPLRSQWVGNCVVKNHQIGVRAALSFGREDDKRAKQLHKKPPLYAFFREQERRLITTFIPTHRIGQAAQLKDADAAMGDDAITKLFPELQQIPKEFKKSYVELLKKTTTQTLNEAKKAGFALTGISKEKKLK